MKKLLIGLGVVVVLFVGALGAFVAVTKARRAQPIDAPYPDITLSTDPEVLARGEYLVYNVVGCDKCHALPEEEHGRAAEARPALQGGRVMSAPGLGSMTFPNITPHPEHGIGRYEPREVARLLRTGVQPDGRFAMTMGGVIGDMSDADLQAIVSFVYSQPPVARDIPPDEMSILYDVLLVWVIGDRVPWPDVADPAPPVGPTVERGAYLAMGPAGCVGCHSPRDGSMNLVQDRLFAGCSMVLDAQDDPGMRMCSPNLTPDPKTGRIAAWSEAQFVARLRAGRAYAGSSMPWEAFRGMEEDDLRAIYRFLQTVEPVEYDSGPTYFQAE